MSEQEINEWYDTPTYGYRGKYRYDDSFSFDMMRPEEFFKYRDTMERLAHYVRRGEERPRLLDVGCSYGHVLHCAGEAGFDAEGIDISPTMVNFAQKKTGVPCHVATLETSPYESASFDVILVRHVFEHLLEPNVFLNKAHSLLRPGGILALELPNVNGWDFRFKMLMAKIGLKKNLGFWHFTGHFFHYSPRTLQALLGKHGFKMETCHTYANRNKHFYLTWRILEALHGYVRFGNKMRVFARRAEHPGNAAASVPI